MKSRYAQVLNVVIDTLDAEGWSSMGGASGKLATRITELGISTASVSAAVDALPSTFFKANNVSRAQVATALMASLSKVPLVQDSGGSVTNVTAGSFSNIAVNSAGAVQSVRVEIAAGDSEGLRRALEGLGAESKRVDDLIALAAAHADAPSDAAAQLRMEGSKLSRAAKKVAASIALASRDFTVATAAAVVAEYLLLFWGH